MIRTVCRCPKCGGVNVSARASVNPNFLPEEPEDLNPFWDADGYTWCDDCSDEIEDWVETRLDFDDEGLVVMPDGRHITLEDWAKETPLENDGDDNGFIELEMDEKGKITDGEGNVHASFGDRVDDNVTKD